MAEPIENIGGICTEHSQQRLKEWQEKNKETVIKAGDYVKTEFKDSSVKQSEHMWVLVTDIGPEQGIIRGTLENEPIAVTNVEAGQQVKIERSQVSEHIPA